MRDKLSGGLRQSKATPPDAGEQSTSGAVRSGTSEETHAEKSYGFAIQDIMDVVNQIEPGTSAGLLLIEHVWATGLKQAVHEAGGHLIVQGFLTPEAMMMIGKEAEAVAEAEAAIEISEAIKGAALLDVLSTIDIAEELKEAASEQALETMTEMQLVKTAAVAEAVRTLVVAGMIEKAATMEAIDALAETGLVEAAALKVAEKEAVEA